MRGLFVILFIVVGVSLWRAHRNIRTLSERLDRIERKEKAPGEPGASS